jgi:soluble lytic murein transglycosylase-like protein
MSITIINYIDQNLVDQVNAQALLRQQEAKTSQITSDFASVLDAASISYSPATTPTVCSSALDSIFTEAANTYGVSAELLKSIARAESNFSATATSSAGACGIMQLMPATAASLGVSNIYDVRENIMGGAQYISSLLEK